MPCLTLARRSQRSAGGSRSRDGWGNWAEYFNAAAMAVMKLFQPPEHLLAMQLREVTPTAAARLLVGALQIDAVANTCRMDNELIEQIAAEEEANGVTDMGRPPPVPDVPGMRVLVTGDSALALYHPRVQGQWQNIVDCSHESSRTFWRQKGPTASAWT
jgi:hypothetical protein